MDRNEEILIKHLDEHGLDIFSFNEIVQNKVLDKRQLNRTLPKLIRSGYLDKIEKGKYCKHNFKDHFVIGSFVTPNGIISYWNAMNYHNLTEQIPNVIFIKTAQRKQNCEFFGIRYIFCNKPEKCMTGYIEEGYGNHRYKISNRERTIVDAFDQHQYAGGYAEIIKAFQRAQINESRLIKYCKEENNLSLIKRLAFLTELLNKPKMEKFIRYAQKIMNKKYSLFEVGGSNTGKYNSRWKMIVNIPEWEIIEMAKS
jgi:predicted transcriptional regulator of viral defense system